MCPSCVTSNDSSGCDRGIPVFSRAAKMLTFSVKTISVSWLGFLFLRWLRTHFEFQVEQSTWIETRSNWRMVCRWRKSWTFSKTFKNIHTWLRSQGYYVVKIMSRKVFIRIRLRCNIVRGATIQLPKQRDGGKRKPFSWLVKKVNTCNVPGTVLTLCIKYLIICWQQLDKVCMVNSFE